jgi:hypothetical protein
LVTEQVGKSYDCIQPQRKVSESSPPVGQ